MSDEVNPLETAEGQAALLGLSVLAAGGEVRIPAQLIRDGFEADQRTAVTYDEDADELIVTVTNGQ